jgi:hypothetical protein
MLVYRPTFRQVDAASAIADIESRVRSLGPSPAHDVARSLLIDAGELEAALVDRECPDEDDATALTSALRRLVVRLAAGCVGSWAGSGFPAGFSMSLLNTLDELRSVSIGGSVALSVPEGFAYYGLFPETYGAAARTLRRAILPEAALVVGIRSIGTTLSAVVAATLAREHVHVESMTVRPRGHPFDRELRVAPRLTGILRDLAARGNATVAIVDEGPGISGSSFSCVAEYFSRLGVADERIVFLPSWNPAAEMLQNERARERWSRHAKFVGDFDNEWLASGRLARYFKASITADLSAGRWRDHVCPAADVTPAIQPQHERRKFLARTNDGERMLIKFEGLSWRGLAHRERAERLAGAGFGPPVLAFGHGFLATRWLDGKSIRVADVNHTFLNRIAKYVAWNRRSERTGESADLALLVEMVDLNVREGLGPEWHDALRHLRALAERIGGEPAVRVDGRMMPHEWLRSGSTFIKTDGASHYDDRFYPGPHDAAWDLAGASVEFELDEAAERYLLRSYATQSSDRDIDSRIHFFRQAYLAFRLGYTALAAQTLGNAPDAAPLRTASARYAQRLRQELSGQVHRVTLDTNLLQPYASGA